MLIVLKQHPRHERRDVIVHWLRAWDLARADGRPLSLLPRR